MLTAIQYNDKGTDFSATDFTKPNYQLWMEKNGPKIERNGKVFSPAFVGSLIHKNSEETNEVNVFKEFSTIRELGGHSIGGTMDRLEIDDNVITVADIKTGGHFPMLKKFRDNNVPDWGKQLSIYRWLISPIFENIATVGKVYVFVLGHQRNKDNMPDEWTHHEELLSNESVEAILKEKIEIAKAIEPPEKDCEKWRCNPKYCDAYNFCINYGVGSKEFS